MRKAQYAEIELADLKSSNSHVFVGPMQGWVAFDTSGQEPNEQVLTVLVDDRRVSS